MEPGETAVIANSIMNEEQQAQFAESPEMNLAISREGLGRFRVDIMRQMNEVSLVIGRLGDSLPNYKELGLPVVLPPIYHVKAGLNSLCRGHGLR
jgi:twitching motility protein PilU